MAIPMAIIVEPPDFARLIFTEDNLNGGMSWEASVRDYFGPQGQGFAKAVEAYLRERLARNAGGGAAERQLLVVEVSAEVAKAM